MVNKIKKAQKFLASAGYKHIADCDAELVVEIVTKFATHGIMADQFLRDDGHPDCWVARWGRFVPDKNLDEWMVNEIRKAINEIGYTAETVKTNVVNYKDKQYFEIVFSLNK